MSLQKEREQERREEIGRWRDVEMERTLLGVFRRYLPCRGGRRDGYLQTMKVDFETRPAVTEAINQSCSMRRNDSSRIISYMKMKTLLN